MTDVNRSEAGRARSREVTDIFSDWAERGRDEGMERGHAAAVAEMLGPALESMAENFRFLDAGCGNGWVVRKVRDHPGCGHAEGVDGSAKMVEKCREADPGGTYSEAMLQDFEPAAKVDLVHSMEVLYYVDDPEALLRHMHGWLEDGGRLVAGIDHYAENAESLEWPAQTGLPMTTWSEARWAEAMVAAGFESVETRRVCADSEKSWAGTLVRSGRKV